MLTNSNSIEKMVAPLKKEILENVKPDEIALATLCIELFVHVLDLAERFVEAHEEIARKS